MDLKVTEIKIVVDKISWVKHGCNDGEIIKVGDTITTARDENGVEYVPIYVDDYDTSNPGESAIITVETGGIVKDIELRRCVPECGCGMFLIRQMRTENVSKDGGNVVIAGYEIRGGMENKCDLSTFICKSSSKFVQISHNTSTKTFSATFDRNDGIERSAKFSFYYNGNVCKSFTLTQSSKESYQSCNERYTITASSESVVCNGGSLTFGANGGGSTCTDYNITASTHSLECSGTASFSVEAADTCNNLLTITADTYSSESEGGTFEFKLDNTCPEGFDSLLSYFNNILRTRQKTEISYANTPNTYKYLCDGYKRALQEYEGESLLFNEDYYDEIYKYRGTNTDYRNAAKNALVSWVMAMQLSELYADYGTLTNTQTELFKAAYDYGTENGGRSIPVYHENDIHSDVFIARYVASAMYAITRSKYNFNQMDSLFRSETNTLPIDRSVSWTDSMQETIARCDNVYDQNSKAGYALNLNSIFPNASGPYANNYYNGELICPTVAARTPDPLQPSEQFNSTTKNYLVDEQIDNIVTTHYNLAANDRDLTRTIQACADDDDSILQMLGGITYYKYNASNPKTSFSAATPTDNMGSFHGTFNVNVIGKDLSSLLSNPDGTETAIRYFFSGVSYIGGHSRQTILDPQYGRRRPGQGEGDALYQGDQLILTSTPRCLCNSGCDTNLNYLNDSSIDRLVGGGTKNDPRHYYADINGNGQWDSSEPYVNDGGGGATNPCAGLHASTYPSGHSSEVWTVALFLMQMIPDKYKEIYKAAYDFTVSRTIVRAHWNSDTMYGKLVGTTMTPIINAFRNAHNGQNFREFYQNAKQMIDDA